MLPDYYVAAGGIVTHGGQVLLLHKHRLDEYVLPKGHVEPGETVEQAALREVREETGYVHLRLLAPLGEALRAEFVLNGRPTVRDETYFLMALDDDTRAPVADHDDAEYDRQSFHRFWLPQTEAAGRLTFEPARTFMRRAVDWLRAHPAPAAPASG